MVLLNMAIRNILRKSTRTLLVSLALCFAIASIISVYSGTEASWEETQKMIGDYQSYIIEMGELTEVQESMIQITTGRGGGGFGGGGFGGGSFRPGGMEEGEESVVLTDEDASLASSVDLVEAVIPLISSSVGEVDIDQMREMMRESREQGGGGAGLDRDELMASFFDYFVKGIPLNTSLIDSYSLLPTNIIEGRTLMEGDSGNAIIKDGLRNFFNAGVGDTIDIEGHTFKIVGIYQSEVNRDNVYMSIDDARTVAGMEEGQLSSIDVYVEDKDYIDLVVLDIQDRFPDVYVSSYADRNAQFSDRMAQAQAREIESLEADNDKVEDTGMQIIIISSITAGLIVLFMMFYTVKERTKEIGVFKALGFKENTIMMQFITEGAIIGLIGGLFGIAVGWAGAPFLADLFLPGSDTYSSIAPSIPLILLGLGFAVALGLIGSIYPAWKASRKSPAEAMRE